MITPLASDTVTTILGFTEAAGAGQLYNSAAVFHRGSVAGLYRKLYPAVNKSIYEAGDQIPVFHVGELTFGIIICNDSNYAEPARIIASRGATVLFIPTNNGLPPVKADVAAHARKVDIALAIEHHVAVIRADVAGRADGMVSYGSSEIIDSNGVVLQSAQRLTEGLIVAEIDTSPHDRSRGCHDHEFLSGDLFCCSRSLEE